MVGQDEEGAGVGAAEDDVEGALGDFDFCDLFAGAVVDEDLAVGDIDVAFGVNGDALAAAIREGLQIAEGAIGVDERAICFRIRC